MNIIERDGVSKSFSNAADTYDFWAKPQKEIALRLVGLLPPTMEYNNILDLGCGTGNVVEQLLTGYPNAKILGIDIAHGMVEYCKERWGNGSGINFLTNNISNFKSEFKYDLIVSSCVFQWIDDFYGVMKNLICSLKSVGRIGIAVPIEGSFFELQESYSSILGRDMPSLKYKSSAYYIDVVKKCGLDFSVAETETVYGYFRGVEVLKYFKKIGATFQYNKDYSPLSVKDIHRLIKYYENSYGLKNGLLPVTHKVLYFVV